MHRSYLIFLLFILLTTACQRAAIPSATPVVNTETSVGNGVKMLTGHCSLAMVQNGSYSSWYQASYNAYQVDTSMLPELTRLLQPVTIEVFLGTWCGDSRRELPHLVKILEAARFDTSRLRLIFVDNAAARYKQSPQHEERNRFIHHVPTIILYNRGEKGRIVESPVVSLEKDMVAILSGSDYKLQYAAAASLQQNATRIAKLLSDEQLAVFSAKLKPLCKNNRELNALGYVLLGQQQYAAALNVFRLNTLLYPGDANTFDSLAEGYALSGNKEKALYYYQKVLQLKPGDENARKQIALLQ